MKIFLGMWLSGEIWQHVLVSEHESDLKMNFKTVHRIVEDVEDDCMFQRSYNLMTLQLKVALEKLEGRWCLLWNSQTT